MGENKRAITDIIKIIKIIYKGEPFFFKYPILSSENVLINKIKDNTKNTIVNISKAVIFTPPSLNYQEFYI